jgi:hypothetical protein
MEEDSFWISVRFSTPLSSSAARGTVPPAAVVESVMVIPFRLARLRVGSIR